MRIRDHFQKLMMVILACSVIMALSGCSGTEQTGFAGDTDTNAVEENTAEITEDAAPAPGVYADLIQNDKTIEITPIQGGITDSTVLPTFSCTFGDMTDEAQNALEEGNIFPK